VRIALKKSEAMSNRVARCGSIFGVGKCIASYYFKVLIMPAVRALYVYPVKSCAGIAVDNVVLEAHGLRWDRHWMVVDDSGRFVSQREHPAMATIRTAITHDTLELSARGLPDTLRLPLTVRDDCARLDVIVWSDTMAALDEGDAAARWFSQALDSPVRLVRFADDVVRLASRDWTGGAEAPAQFADGFPLLVASVASLDEVNKRLVAKGATSIPMNRFRPNIVLSGIDPFEEDFIDTLALGGQDNLVLGLVKPCTRCSITTIDQLTGKPHPDWPHEPLDTLSGWRADPRVNGGLTFGQNALVVSGVGLRLSVGVPVTYTFRFGD
jgi:uncharacterized protein YcbX